MVISSAIDIEKLVASNMNLTIYNLAYPYFGVRGTVNEVKAVFDETLKGEAIGGLAYIGGNQPLNIKSPTTSIPTNLIEESKFTGEGTIIGIIGTGIDYTDPCFTNKEGNTRIINIWDQTIGVSAPYGYGTVYDEEIINTALKSDNPSEIVPHYDGWGEGTILAGIAAGENLDPHTYYRGIAPNSQLAIVKLKPASASMQEIYHTNYNPLAFSTLDIALSIKYLVELSAKYGKPISICLPIGTNSSGHDGSNILSRIITNYAHSSGISMIIGAGDEANKSNHASGDLRQANNQNIRLTIPKGQNGFMIEIWADFGDEIEATLTPPANINNVINSIPLNIAGDYIIYNTNSVWSAGSVIDLDTGCQAIKFRLNNPIVGIWNINIKPVNIIEGIYHIWIPKTGMILDQTTLHPADPFTTLLNESTPFGGIAVGCYDPRAKSVYFSSGRGFTRDNRVKPDFVVDGVNIPGPLPGNNFGTITGTAPSSAMTTGVCALIYESQIQNGQILANTPVMRAQLVKYLDRELTVKYPNPSSGYGVLTLNYDEF